MCNFLSVLLHWRQGRRPHSACLCASSCPTWRHENRNLAKGHQFSLSNTCNSSWSSDTTLSTNPGPPSSLSPALTSLQPFSLPWMDLGQINFPKPDVDKPVVAAKLLCHRDSLANCCPATSQPCRPWLQQNLLLQLEQLWRDCSVYLTPESPYPPPPYLRPFLKVHFLTPLVWRALHFQLLTAIELAMALFATKQRGKKNCAKE